MPLGPGNLERERKHAFWRSFCDLPEVTRGGGQGRDSIQGVLTSKACPFHCRSWFPGISDLLVRRTRESALRGRGGGSSASWQEELHLGDCIGVWRLRGCPHSQGEETGPALSFPDHRELTAPNSTPGFVQRSHSPAGIGNLLPPAALGQRHQRNAAPLLAPRFPGLKAQRDQKPRGRTRSTQALSILQTSPGPGACVWRSP